MTEKEYSRIHLFVKSKKYAQKRKFIKYLFSIFPCFPPARTRDFAVYMIK